jgi:ubiquinone/menaquinone biosynthesis C-methylase UbiE
MGFYATRILPHLIDLGMRQEILSEYRRRVVPAARGRVLEVGIGSGVNLALYTPAATLVVGLDSSPQLLAMAGRARARGTAPSVLVESSAESLPLENESVDTVVTTWTLCSIPDVTAALREMRRVLKPSGALLFVEHGRAADPAVRRWQNWLTPAWKRFAGGCHLNRPVRELVEAAGFQIERLDTGYMKGPRPMTFMYEGRARRN